MTVRILLVCACLALAACGSGRSTHYTHRQTTPANVVINIPYGAYFIREGYYMVPMPQPVRGCPAYRGYSTIATVPETVYFRDFDGRFVLIPPVNCTTVLIAPPEGHIPPGLIDNPGLGHGRGNPGLGHGVANGSDGVVVARPIVPGNSGQRGNGNASGGGLSNGSGVVVSAPPIVPGNSGQRGNGNSGGGFSNGSNAGGGAPPIVTGNSGQRGNGNSGNAGGAASCPADTDAGPGSSRRCR